MIGPEKLASLSQPIRCKTKTNHDLVCRVFPGFGQIGWFHFEFSLALQGIFLSSDWPLQWFGLILSSHGLFRVFSFLLICHCNDLVLVSQLSIEKRSNALCAFFGFFLGGATAPFTTFVPSSFFLSRPRFLHSWKFKALTVTSSFFLTRKESIYCAKWTT